MTTTKKNKNTTTTKKMVIHDGHPTRFLTRAALRASRVINSFITICDYDEEKDIPNPFFNTGCPASRVTNRCWSVYLGVVVSGGVFEQLKARLILRRKLNLTRQRHDRDQTENQPRQPWTAVSSYLALVSTV